MAPEPSQRSRRHRSHPRAQSQPRRHERSPSREPSRRRPQHDVRPSFSPTRERSRERRRPQQDAQLRSKSRTPGSGRGSRDSRGKSVKRPRVRFSMIESEGAAEALTAKATRSGFLRKQADNEPGAWNRYYFVLKPLTYLLYYNSEEDETPRGIIDLEYLTDIKRNADCLQRAVGGGDNCFRVSGKLPRPTAEQTAMGEVAKMRPLYLDTDDDGEAEKWMDAIRNHRFSMKKDEQFFEMVHQLRDAEFKAAQLEDTLQKEGDTKTCLRVKAKTLLQKMRAVDSGNTDELPEVNVEDLDDTADDMLAMLEGMEDVLVNFQAKLEQQKQELAQLKAGTVSTRRNIGFTQVIQRAVSRRENTSFLELSEDEEEETLAAIKSRRNRKPREDPPVIQEKPQEKPKEKVREKPKEKPKETARDKPKEKIREEPKERVREEPPPSQDNVSDVLAMWKAKKKKTPSPPKQPAPEDDDDEEEDSRNYRNRTMPRSVRGRTTAPETGSAPQSARKYTSVQKRRGSERSSEEDTASLDSTDDRESGEKLPPGWVKHESRGYPGTYYYAHESGKVSWEVPTEDMAGGGDNNEAHHEDRRNDPDEFDEYDIHNEYDDHNDLHDHDDQEEEPDIYVETSADTSAEYLSEYETDNEEAAGATTSAAYRKKKPKPKSAWTFKLPKLLPTNNPTAAAPPEAAASLSPIRRGFNHHEF
ncbi:hypothetical protein KRP22_008443 [Phytophthora ramorum]|uniref:uncharacterized protein n=1 Tax=Phytophthora ramorum TaxID=164328 RepID=UPI0030AB4218|nr:hypothetical protein KRP23_14671 [Phytophthora ramorum]KAH7494997.1 hypothetical protein KRP22_15194 [Phytophthora ramorum]